MADDPLNNVVEQLAQIDAKALSRTDLHDLNFEPAVPAFLQIRLIAQCLDRNAIDVLSNEAKGRLLGHLQNYATYANSIIGFRIRSGDLSRSRQELLASVTETQTRFFRECPELVVVALHAAQRKTAAEEEARAIVSRLGKLEADAQAFREKSVREAEGILATMQQAAGKTAIANYSKFFNDEADSAKDSAWLWLIASAVSGIATVWYLCWLVFFWSATLPDYTIVQAIQSGGAKIALFSVAFYILGWCGRNFKAQWHLFVVNKHRQNALNSLEAFSESAKESATKEAILIHASTAIFAQVQTGFIPEQSDSTPSPSILEVIRGSGT